MNQPPFQNPDLQPNNVTKPQGVNCCPENEIQGNENRAIQGDEYLAVQGDGNTVSQNSKNLNGSGSNFIRHMQADKIIFVNSTYLETGSEEKFNGSQASVEKKEGINNKGKATFVFTGTIDIVDENFLKVLEAHLRKKSKDAELTILKVEEGSIKITLEASQESLELLKNLFESGQLTEVLDIPVEDVQILSESSDDGESNELDNKSRLVREILSQPVYVQKLNFANLTGTDLRRAKLTGAYLIGTDLTGAYLIGTDLTGAYLIKAKLTGAYLRGAILIEAYLRGADLRGADLRGADLRGAILRGADLKGADLRGADLRGAYLIEANLIQAKLMEANLEGANVSDAILENAIVVNALFGRSVGLTEDMKRHLEQRGAIFGDRPPVLVPR